MNRSRTLRWLLICAALWCAAVTANDGIQNPAAVTDGRDSIQAGRPSPEFRRSAHEHVTSQLADDGRLISIALAAGAPQQKLLAAWSRLLRAKDDTRKCLKSGAVERFSGFLEGISGTTLPEWWLRSLRMNEVQVADPEDWRHLLKELPPPAFIYFHEEESSIDALVRMLSRPLQVRESGSQIRFVTDRRSCLVEKKALGDVSERIDELDAALDIDDSTCAVAWYDNSSVRQLSCIDVKTGKVLWTAEPWGLPQGLIVAHSDQRVTLQLTPDAVVLFGKANGNVFCEKFSRDTGRAEFRWASNLWWYLGEQLVEVDSRGPKRR